jgi:glycine cleavage system H protein
MKFPEDCLYTRQHEWVRVLAEKETALVGITDYAQKELGDVVFVELPKVGDTFDTNEPFGNVESVMSASKSCSELGRKSHTRSRSPSNNGKTAAPT